VFGDFLVEMHTNKFGHAPPRSKDLIPFLSTPETNTPQFPAPRTKQEIYAQKLKAKRTTHNNNNNEESTENNNDNNEKEKDKEISSFSSSSSSSSSKKSFLEEIENFNREKLNHAETEEKNKVEVIAAKGQGYSGANEDLHDYYDDENVLKEKARLLADLIGSSKKCLVYTGAGISTSAKIPDYRSASGVWTMQDRAGIKSNRTFSLAGARPTFAHMAIAQLVKLNKVALVVSTNIDGLHLKSGIPLDKLVELHGNCFVDVWNIFILKSL
jgi:hypothetical protein